VNDINSNLTLFADYVLSLNISDTKEGMFQKMQTSVNSIQNWCTVNELFVSETKTKIMFFRNKEDIKQEIFIHSEGCLEGNCLKNCTKLEVVNKFKYLGLEIDHKGAFDFHIDNVIKKLRQVMPKLYFLKNILNTENKMIIYDAWLKSHIQYALEIYGTAKQKEIKRLQKIQNKVVKILFSSPSGIVLPLIFSKNITY